MDETVKAGRWTIDLYKTFVIVRDIERQIEIFCFTSGKIEIRRFALYTLTLPQPE